MSFPARMDAPGENAPPIVGRERELTRLHHLLDAALVGQGCVVLIGGTAGIGKTALVEALGRAAMAAGALVLSGGAYDFTETPPYGPWNELLARYPAEDGLPALPALLGGRGGNGPIAGPDTLFTALREFLAAVTARRPLLLVIEDLHWADPATLELLRRVGREARTLPLLIVATYRDDEVGPGHPLHTLLPILVREARAERLDLRPLDAAAIGELAAARYMLAAGDLARLVSYLEARAEGNPFFLGELLRALEYERALHPIQEHADRPGVDAAWALGDLADLALPPLLRQILDRRLERLPDDDHQLLAVAAVIGQEVPFGLWSTVTLLDEEAAIAVIERAVAARVLDALPDGLTLRFSHALVRAALYEGLFPPRRRVWHRRVAEALLEAPNPDPDMVAEHFRRAGDARAAAWLLRAAERARRAFAWESAARRYEAALDLLGASDEEEQERAWALYHLASLLRFVDPERGLDYFDRAAQLAGRRADALLTAVILFDRGSARCHALDLRQGLADLEAGVAALDALEVAGADVPERYADSFPERTTRLSRLAAWRTVVGQYDEARALYGELLGLVSAAPGAERPGAVATVDPAAIGEIYHGLGIIEAARGRPAAARRYHEQARAHFVALGYRMMVARAVGVELSHTVVPYFPDEPGTLAMLEAAAREAHGHVTGTHGGELPADDAGLLLLAQSGRWDEALALAPALRAIGVPYWESQALPVIGHLQRARGDADAAWRIVHELLPEAAATEPGGTPYFPSLGALHLGAALALDAGDLSAARRWLTALGRWLDWNGSVQGRADAALLWALHDRAAGDLAGARRRATQLLQDAAAPRQPTVLLAARRILGELDTATGRYAVAAAHLDAALAIADACAAPQQRAAVLLSLARLQRASGDSAAAEAASDEARTILEQLGVGLSPADAGAAPPREERPDGLSAREWEVLALIAAGENNTEIADSLSLSIRTVERHINGLYRKIDARGRADAVAYAVRHGLLPH